MWFIKHAEEKAGGASSGAFHTWEKELGYKQKQWNPSLDRFPTTYRFALSFYLKYLFSGPDP
jgi:hypothetical protein